MAGQARHLSCNQVGPRPRLWLGLLGAVAVGAGLAGAAQAGFGELDDVDYRGSLIDHPEAIVEVDRFKRRIGITADQVPLSCDDGSVRTLLLFPLYMRVRSKGRFSGQRYHIDGSATEEYYEFRGRVRRDQVTGSVFVLFDQNDNPGAPHSVDCSSRAQLHWVADRVP